METFLFLLELAGTVAFAVSGAVLGIEKHMDIFGVGLLGITTAVGGGILRDLVVGLTPPRAFQDPIYLLVALGVSVVLFFPFVRRIIGRSKRVFDALMLIMDAAGLGIFTITGMNTATTLAGCTDPLLLVFVGLLTGTGGGVLYWEHHWKGGLCHDETGAAAKGGQSAAVPRRIYHDGQDRAGHLRGQGQEAEKPR